MKHSVQYRKGVPTSLSLKYLKREHVLRQKEFLPPSSPNPPNPPKEQPRQKHPLEWLADEWVDYFWGELEDNMSDEILKAFGPAIGQAPIPPMPSTSQTPQPTPATVLYPPIELPKLLHEAPGAQDTQQEVAAPAPDSGLGHGDMTGAGLDVELAEDSIPGNTAAAGVGIAADPGIPTATVPEIIHDVAPMEKVKMTSEPTNYLTMLPPMAMNLLGTILTEQHQVFLSNTKNQNPIKAMSFFMTKEGREGVNQLIELYAQYCKQFD